MFNENKLKPEDVKIGTEIVESRSGYGFRGYEFGKVIRETKTQWVTDLGTRYKKENLRVMGSDSYGCMIAKTKEHVEMNKKYILTKKIGSILHDLSMIRNMIPRDLTTEELKDIFLDLNSVEERLVVKGESDVS